MEKFIWLKSSKAYWIWDLDKMVVYNYNHGWHNIDENSDDFLNATVVDAEDWHDLYKKTGWHARECSVRTHDVWISTDGKCYFGDAHSLEADNICEIFFGEDFDERGEWYLEEHGWIKATTSLMWEVRLNELGMDKYMTITRAQSETLKEWCEIHGKEYPEPFIRVIG